MSRPTIDPNGVPLTPTERVARNRAKQRAEYEKWAALYSRLLQPGEYTESEVWSRWLSFTQFRAKGESAKALFRKYMRESPRITIRNHDYRTWYQISGKPDTRVD